MLPFLGSGALLIPKRAESPVPTQVTYSHPQRESGSSGGFIRTLASNSAAFGLLVIRGFTALGLRSLFVPSTWFSSLGIRTSQGPESNSSCHELTLLRRDINTHSLRGTGNSGWDNPDLKHRKMPSDPLGNRVCPARCSNKSSGTLPTFQAARIRLSRSQHLI